MNPIWATVIVVSVFQHRSVALPVSHTQRHPWHAKHSPRWPFESAHASLRKIVKRIVLILRRTRNRV